MSQLPTRIPTLASDIYTRVLPSGETVAGEADSNCPISPPSSPKTLKSLEVSYPKDLSKAIKVCVLFPMGRGMHDHRKHCTSGWETMAGALIRLKGAIIPEGTDSHLQDS